MKNRKVCSPAASELLLEPELESVLELETQGSAEEEEEEELSLL